MFYTDDPLADFHHHDMEKQRRLERLPRCSECGEHIQQEDAVCMDGYWYCDQCLKDLRVRVDEY